jgi:hypothetical protein
MLLTDWNQILDNILPDESNEAIISNDFVRPLIKALGFNKQEQIPEFPTGNGTVDFAIRKNTVGDIFSSTKTNPYLLVEVKARATGSGAKINLLEGTPQYISTREQIKRYLLASECNTSQWGIITNSIHIQLFRRHGRDEIFTRLSYLTNYKIDSFEVDVEKASDIIFSESKGKWKSLNPISKLDCGIDAKKIKTLKKVFSL